MNCTEARDRLLEADLAELESAVETDLSLHLRDCAACRTMAERLAAEERSLAAVLSSMPPRVDVEEAVARAMAAPGSGRRILPFPLRRAWGLVPLAAAAAATAVLVTSNGGQLPGEPMDVVSARQDPVPTVETYSGHSVAVFETQNPDIVVVWTF